METAKLHLFLSSADELNYGLTLSMLLNLYALTNYKRDESFQYLIKTSEFFASKYFLG